MRSLLAFVVLVLLATGAWAADAVVRVEFRAAEDTAAAPLVPMTTPDGTTIYVSPHALLTNTDIAAATAEFDSQTGVPIVRLVFTEEGGRKLEEVTTARVGRMIAIVVEGRLMSAPRIMEPISAGEAVITGNFTSSEAERLAAGIVPPPPKAPQR